MTTFGDENALMDNPQTLPSGLPFKPYCVQDTAAPDVLCTDSLTSGIKLPTSLSELRQLLGDKLEGLKAVATNPAQIAAALKFPAQLLGDLPKVLGSILKDIATGKVRRWLVLPQHFKYGNNGMAADAARWVADVVRGE
jgi:cutinase